MYLLSLPVILVILGVLILVGTIAVTTWVGWVLVIVGAAMFLGGGLRRKVL
jgi:uncharacterized membrane protein